MGFFDFMKKKVSKNKEEKSGTILENYITAQVQSGIAENAVIAYILTQSKENNIELAYKDNVTFVSFRNETLQRFLEDWYGLLRLYEAKKLSEKAYAAFITTTLSEVSSKPKEVEKKEVVTVAASEKGSDKIDAYDDIFGGGNQ